MEQTIFISFHFSQESESDEPIEIEEVEVIQTRVSEDKPKIQVSLNTPACKYSRHSLFHMIF